MSLLEGLTRPSLARRLVILASGGIVAALAIAAVVLALLFQQAALRRFDANLSDLIDNLIAGTTIEQGEVVAPALTDLRALRALSGRYWEIAEVTPDGKMRAVEELTSRSLYQSELYIPPDLAQRLQADPGKPIAYDAPGPQPGERVRVLARWTTFYGLKQPLVFLAAEDSRPVDREVAGFVTATAVAFGLLGLGLIVAVIVQVRVGLRPLFRLRTEVAEVRRGKTERLQGAYPSELRPLTDELNALVAHNQETVERQRTHVGNLAHALKTPI
ncbi:MAG: sensor histidine kinase, partial [Thermoleophilia bacterium]|nr:sensor histidine kinase [Thermoleophilia bacterium]